MVNAPKWMQNNVFPLYLINEKVVPPKGWPTKESSDYNWNQDNIIGYGIRGGDNLLIIDIDNKDDQSATAQLTMLINAGLDADTYMQRTKSNGFHLIYNNKTGIDIKTRAALPAAIEHGAMHVDIRGSGGYVVGAGKYPGGTYEVINDVPPADYDDTQMAILQLEERGAKSPPADISALPSIDDMTAFINPDELTVQQMLSGSLIKNGVRDQHLLKLSGYIVDNNLSKAQVKEIFTALNIEGTDFSLEDLVSKVDRDKLKTADVDNYYTTRLIYIEEDNSIWDRQTKFNKKFVDMKLHIPQRIPSASGKTTRSVIDVWNESPNRQVAQAIGWQPTLEETFYDGLDTIVNTFKATEIIPWDKPVDISDEDLADYFKIMRLVCDNKEQTFHLMLGQHAAKLQDLTWKPGWGFVIITPGTHNSGYRIGKDFIANVFGSMLGNGTYKKTITTVDVQSGRFTGMLNSLLTVINEPGGATGNSFGATAYQENLKMLFSEKSMSIKEFYKDRAADKPIYSIAQMHSNYHDAANISQANKRFAPIISKQQALNSNFYAATAKEAFNKQSPLIRKLYRLLMDWEVPSEINEAAAPDMVDSAIAAKLSIGEDINAICDAIDENLLIWQSDIQTVATISLALKVHHNIINASHVRSIMRRLTDNGLIKSLTNRARGLPEISMDDNDTYGDMIESLTKRKSTATPRVFTIRNHDIHASKTKQRGYVKDNFFPKVGSR